jgi:hypothetical protein
VPQEVEEENVMVVAAAVKRDALLWITTPCCAHIRAAAAVAPTAVAPTAVAPTAVAVAMALQFHLQ